jgi:chitin disaccharide deacetylase
MIKIIWVLFAFGIFYNSANAQQRARLLVRGDDMGYTHSGNLALIKCYKEGIQKSIEVIVPSPWFPEAVKMLQENPSVDVGLHLALTSEWDHIKWRPLTDCKSLRDSNGYFYPMVFPNKNYPGQSISENKPDLKDVEMEVRAQIEMAKKHIPRVSHISAHMGCSRVTNEVRALVSRLAKEYGLIDESDLKNINYIGFGRQLKTSEEKIAHFIKILDTLQPGKTYLFVEHPGFDDQELRAVSHIGYENVAADRQGVTDLFTSQRVKDKIREKDIQLIDYREVNGER